MPRGLAILLAGIRRGGEMYFLQLALKEAWHDERKRGLKALLS